jgi:acyl-CoA synthetase (AMP-forming)/AMP-acid ligase II
MSLTSLCSLFTDDRRADSPVAQNADTTIDFARFRVDVAWNALRLRRHGCRHGLLHTRDCYWGAVGLFALLHAGAEVVIPQNAQPKSLAAISDAWDLMVCDEAPEMADSAVLLEPGGQGEGHELGALDRSTPVSFFTSGSTGAPKRVTKALDHLDQELKSVDALLRSVVPPAASVQATVTHQHVYGMTFRLCWPLASGRPFGRIACEFWETALAELRRGTALISSPAHLERLGGIAPIPSSDRPSLVLSAGAPLSESAIQTAAAVFSTSITEIFGSTETGAIAWRRHDERDPLWQPLPSVRIGSTPEGLLRVTALHVSGREYTTSDRAQVYPDGRFAFRGRNDSVVKIEGKRVSLPELEEHLRGLDWVADAAVVTIAGPVAQLAAAVVPNAAGATILANVGAFRFNRILRQALAARYETDELPRRWRFVTDLPSGPLGKRDSGAITRLFERNPVVGRKTPPHEPEIRAVRRRADGADFDLFIPSDLAYVEGHFPNAPIVPGVALIHWAVKFAARHLDFPLETAQAFQVKFRRVTLPGIPVTLSLRRTSKPDRLIFEYTSATRVLSSGSVAMDIV